MVGSSVLKREVASLLMDVTMEAVEEDLPVVAAGLSQRASDVREEEHGRTDGGVRLEDPRILSQQQVQFLNSRTEPMDQRESSAERSRVPLVDREGAATDPVDSELEVGRDVPRPRRQAQPRIPT